MADVVCPDCGRPWVEHVNYYKADGTPAAACPISEPPDCAECYGHGYDTCGNPCPECNPDGPPPLPITPIDPGGPS